MHDIESQMYKDDMICALVRDGFALSTSIYLLLPTFDAIGSFQSRLRSGFQLVIHVVSKPWTPKHIQGRDNNPYKDNLR